MPSPETTASNGVYTNGVQSNSVNGNSHSSANQNGSYLKANHHLNIIIVGAGIAGLALAGILGHSGHKVIVLEAAPMIAEVGAGINCSPNLTRLLARWGLDKRVLKHTNSLTRIDLRRWKDGEFLGAATLMPEIERRHGAPQYAIHRADLHGALMEEAELVAEVRINSTVASIDFDKPSVTLSDGSMLEADTVVGADGMKSTCRRLIYQNLGLLDKARPTGDAAFRACIPLDVVTDPELRAFITEPVATRWMGPDRHVQAYPIRHGNLYNMVMCHPDTGFSEESWTAKASKGEILDHFGSWDPVRLRKLLDFIPDENVMKWRLCEHDPLPTWVMGKVVLLGDACHPMLPYVAQGAAQAIEDVGVLCLALNHVSKPDEIPTLLKAFEVARKSRAEHVAGTGGATRRVLHLHDGPDQQARDKKFKEVSKGGENPDLLGDAKAQSFLWGYDPEKEFLDNFESK
ncbi:uncharacterized protein A1O5_05942 [Cladophialophora psammophila CBS 110553]|uniref:FAD-binding domain-containing protein n=1 Tax=Cladophialophora psammophila CBS 110553 TaxID=1182543 RepID=W9X0X3_9EURO|nr:uncharacterized protein A1O5_05942 [Cladophialophora psammophila CBS 110553]EXJ70950.1 hypothetical protein A1O5_05942 [Cladophialophora psammophila CBS 110553]